MSLLGRYLARTVIAGTLVAVLVIISLELVFAFVEEAGDIGSRDYTAGSAFLYILLTAPQRAYEAFPIATLIGSLMGLGGLAARNELTAMRAAGVSILGVARAVVVAGLVLASLAFALGEWVAPPAERWGQQLRSSALSDNVAAGDDAGFWARDGSHFVQVQRAVTDVYLQGIRIYELGGGREINRIVNAAQARYENGAWRLQDVVITRFVEGGVETERLPAVAWDSELRPEVLDVIVVEPETLPVTSLYAYIQYLERNGLESARYRLAYWIKLVTPLATVTMLLLAIPLVFGSVRSAGAGQRIFIGVMIGIVFFLANRMLNHMGLIYGLPPWISAALPTVVFMCAGLFGIVKVR
jgi:lipopolysaccharide export system permease protein